jgi:membrane protease YdiL (CAAX protease family)
VVLAALAWITMQITGQVVEWLEPKEPVQKLTLPVQKLALQEVQSACAVSLVVLIFMLSLLALSGRSRRRDAGVTLQLWKQDLLIGSLGFLASLLPVFLVLWVTSSWRSRETTHSFFKIMQDNPGGEGVAWVGLAAVILAPLTEEIVFRVILQGWLETRLAPRWAIGIVALVFAAVHGFPDSLALLPLALILGYVYHRRHSYLAVVVLHAWFNTWNLVFSLLVGQPEATSNPAILL